MRSLQGVFTSFDDHEVHIDDPPGTEEADKVYPRPIDPDDRLCDFNALKVGNNINHWTGIPGDIRRAYDQQLKGVEIQQWWPGATMRAECNDSTAVGRGCWYRTRLLNDPFCTETKRCLHVAAHDGEPSHSYTCPQWLRDPSGHRCKLPADNDWQACPMKYQNLRIAGAPGVLPQDRAPSSAEQFKAAINVQCSDVQLAEKVATDDLAPPPHMEGTSTQHTTSTEPGDHSTTSFEGEPAHDTIGTDTHDTMGTDNTEKDGDEHDTMDKMGLPKDDDVHKDDGGDEATTNSDSDSVMKAIEEMKPSPECEQKCEGQCGSAPHQPEDTAVHGKQNKSKTSSTGPEHKGKGDQSGVGAQSEKVEKCMETCLTECQANFKKDHCLGPITDSPDNNFFFDVKSNTWYWCTPDLRCSTHRIKQISYPTDGKCGKRSVCGQDEGCFEHEVTSKKSVFHCVPKTKTFVIGAGDDEGLQSAMPLPMVLLAPVGCWQHGGGRKVKRRQIRIEQFL
mmetsp:Transcript_27622/g.60770  ORF Transcript_27622/g.60770 Transcript_27622/m.60770 type:complete len:505 (+) Transcript_27622:54-1568(+)